MKCTITTTITKREKIWLDKLFEIEFKGKKILKQQIVNAEVIERIYYPYGSLKFSVKKKVKKYPYNVRVPIEMRAFQKSLSPVVFLLHVIDGIIDELEIFTADISELDVFNIDFDNVEYVVDDEVREN